MYFKFRYYYEKNFIDNRRFVLAILQIVLVLAMIIPVTNAGSQSNDNFTIFSHSSMISIPLDVRKDVDNEIIKKIASNDIIKEKMVV